jgi:hypothetical protein
MNTSAKGEILIPFSTSPVQTVTQCLLNAEILLSQAQLFQLIQTLPSERSPRSRDKKKSKDFGRGRRQGKIKNL